MPLTAVTPRFTPSAARQDRRNRRRTNRALRQSRALRCEWLEDRCLLSGPDVRVTQLDWNILRDYAPQWGWRGVDVSYQVAGADLPAGCEAAFYWARGPSRGEVLGGPIAVQTLEWAQGSYQLNDPALWDRPPLRATHLLVVADPDNAIAESDETNNVAALRVHSADEILAGALRLDQPDEYTVRAEFRPGGGLYTISEAELVLGVHHFNWINQLDVPGAMEVRRSDASGYTVLSGRRMFEPPTAVADLGELVLYSPLGQPATEPFVGAAVDARPLYWNEPGWWYAPLGGLDVRQHVDGRHAEFRDSPRIPAGFFGPGVGDHLEFSTRLVGVAPDGSAIALAEVPGFAWKTNAVYADRNENLGAFFISDADSVLPEPIFGGVYDVAWSDGDLPIARDDFAHVGMDGPAKAIDVLANDSDPASGVLAIAEVGTPAFGSASLDDGGTPDDPRDDRIVYAPLPGYFGPDTLSYLVVRRSGEPGFATATVIVDVAPPVFGLGVAGDELSDEYAGRSLGDARGWVEILAGRGIPFGTWDSFGEPRRSGFEFNWARVGATSRTLLADGQHTGLAGQVAFGLVNYAVLEVGRDDFVLSGDAYDGIYLQGLSGGWTSAQIEDYADYVVENVETALAALVATGAGVVLVGVPDYGLTPLAPLLYTSPDRRQLVADVISGINARLEDLGALYRVPMIDLFAFDRAMRGTHRSWIKWQEVGGVEIFNSAGPDPEFAFAVDGVHPGTVYQALTANLVLEAMSLGYGAAVDDYRLSEQEILLEAGLTYRGEDTLPVACADYVVLPSANRLPVTHDDQYTLDENGSLATRIAGGVVANDADPNADVLSAVLVSGPAHGTLRLKADGSFRYTPAASFHGTDGFTYKASDGRGESAGATVTLLVNAVNEPPSAAARAMAIAEDEPVSIVLSGDDGDPEDVQKLAFAVAAGPSHGKLSGLDPVSGKVTYTPDKDYNGVDGFTFTVTDDDAAGLPARRTSVPATVSIAIAAVNDAPWVPAQGITVAEDGTAAFALAADDGDPEVAQSLTFAITSGPSHGRILGFDPATGRGTYAPDPQYHGPDAFEVTVTDDSAAGPPAARTSAPTSVPVSVTPVNDPPVAYGQTLFVDWNAAAEMALAGADGDPEIEQNLVFAIAGGPSHGKLSVLDAATGRVRYTPDPDFHGTDTFRFTVTDDDRAGPPAAIASLQAEVTLRVARPAAAEGFAELKGENPAAGELWYRWASVREGVVSVEALAGSPDAAHLGLYAPDGRQLAASEPVGGNARIDRPAAAAGEPYFVRLAGTASRVDLRMANLLRLVDRDAIVFGTGGSDSFEFRAGGATRRVAIRGVAYEFDPASLASVAFDGNGGIDSAVLSGSPGRETAVCRPGSATLSGEGFLVSVSRVADVTVQGLGGGDSAELFDSPAADVLTSYPDSATLAGGGTTSRVLGFAAVIASSSAGSDLAKLYDSPGDDTFEAGPSRATLAGPGFSCQVNRFPFVQAYAGGGNNVAQLDDSPGNDQLVATPAYGVLYGSGFYNRANGFATLVARASAGGIDLARLNDSGGNDLLAASSTGATLAGIGFSNRAEGFRYVAAYASSGVDAARLADSPGTDTFVGTPTYASMSGAAYSIRAGSFDSVEAASSPGQADVAKLYDSPGNETLAAWPGDVTLAGKGFSHRARQFRFVHAYATAGGTDAAELYDSPATDTLVAYSTYAALYGPEFYNRANYFDSVRVYGGAGGVDLAKLYDSPGDDAFDGSAGGATLSGPGFSNRVERFASVVAFATAGGDDTAILRDTPAGDTLTGTPDYVRLAGPGVDHSVRGFKRVYLQGGSGGDDRATWFDSAGDDLLEAAGRWARLSYPDRMIYLADFPYLKAVSSRGGADAKRLAAVDFLLETQGPWTDAP